MTEKVPALTHEKPDNDQPQPGLNEIFETPHMKVNVVDETLLSLAKARPDMEVYRNYFYLLTHLEFEEADAVRHWDEFKQYHAKFEKDLGYSIDTRITTLGYFINKNKLLKSPKIIEMKVFQSTQDKVILDELTSLYNYRHFRQRIKAEMQSAVDREEMLSLIIVDIDGFKHINDGYGHLAGDGILRQIATFIKAEISNQGETFRYGGEEFAVIVPRAGKQGVYDIANKLCEEIAAHAFVNENSAPRHQIPVTASLGVAAYPQDCDDSDMLVGNADKALYNAKGSGKNIVCLYSENQRRTKRLDSSVRGELTSFRASTVNIRTLNVSKGGVRFFCEKELARDSVVELKLDLAKNKKDAVTVLCRIINRNPDNDAFVYGAEVVQINKRDRVRFNRFVDALPVG
jgi:diguanylate cyclase (GGDEF)-like protein